MRRSPSATLLVAVAVALLASGCGQIDLGREVSPVPANAVPPNAIKYRAALLQAWQYYFGLQDAGIAFGQVHQESRFDCAVVSPGGSMGCAQFTPGTAEDMQRVIPREVRATCPRRSGCPMDPRWAFTAMVQYDWQQWSAATWARETRERWGFTLAAYNGGAGWTSGSERKVCERTRGCDPNKYFEHVERMCGTTGRAAPACRENRQYPRIILDHWAPMYRRWLAG
jgi:hypothetical protein